MTKRKALSSAHLWRTIRNSKPQKTMPKISTDQLRKDVQKLKKIEENPGIGSTKRTKARTERQKKERELNHRVAGHGGKSIFSSPFGGQPKS